MIVHQSDEFTVEHDNGQTFLMDGEQTIRVQMPTEVWNELHRGPLLDHIPSSVTQVLIDGEITEVRNGGASTASLRSGIAYEKTKSQRTERPERPDAFWPMWVAFVLVVALGGGAWYGYTL